MKKESILMNSKYIQSWEKYGVSDLSPYSVRQYRSSIRKFERFILESGFEGELDFDQFFYVEQTKDFEPIDSEYIEEFLLHLNEEGASTNVLHHAFYSLRHLFIHMENFNLIKKNPIYKVTPPKYEKILVDRSLNKDECAKLLEVSYNMDPFFKKYYVMVLLMVTCGLRANEMIQLKLSQINFEQGLIIINNGQKYCDGTVYMSANMKEALFNYVNHPSFQAWSKGNDTEVFFDKGRTYSYEKFRTLIKSMGAKADIGRKVTAHDLRHTMAYFLLLEGINPRVIQRQLRHKHLVTTLRYLPKDITAS